MPLITLSPGWRAIAGFLHGLPQPALLGRVWVTPVPAATMAALDAFLADVVPLPDDQPPTAVEADTALSLLQRVGFWTGEIQRHARMAVAPQVHLRPDPAPPVPPPAEGAVALEMALPSHRPRAATACLTLVCKVACVVGGGLPKARQAVLLDALRTELADLLERLRNDAEPGFNQLHLLSAAFRLGLPVQRVAGPVFQLGTGARARLMESSLSEQTAALGVRLAQDKWVTSRMLRAIGLPGTVNERVTSVEQALDAATRLGYPVVVKPADQDQGRGVAARLHTPAGVRAAFTAAQAVSPNLLVERHVDGFGHRFTVHDGDLIAVLRRIPGGVVGDGSLSVAGLLQAQLQHIDVRRSLNLGRVSLDAEALEMLAEVGLGPDHVPAAGQFVLLRRRDNISAGGRLEHLDPADVHPDNRRAALRAARALRLDLAGVDFLCPDIRRSWREVGGAICEVNAKPQFGPGRQGRNYDRVLGRLLGSEPRIPVHVLLGAPSATADLATLDAWRERLGLQALSAAPDRTSPEGQVWVQGQWQGSHGSDWDAGHAALADLEVESLLMVLSPQAVLRRGLPVDRVDAVHLLDADAPADERALLQQARACCGLR